MASASKSINGSTIHLPLQALTGFHLKNVTDAKQMHMHIDNTELQQTGIGIYNYVFMCSTSSKNVTDFGRTKRQTQLRSIVPLV